MTRSIVAEFYKDRRGGISLFSVTAVEDHGAYLSRTIYDVDHSKEWGYLFHQSGAGGGDVIPASGIYFVSGNVQVEERPTTVVDPRGRRTKALRKMNRTRRLLILPKEFAIEPGRDLLDWLQNEAVQEDAVWCSICQDHVRGDYLCCHSWWCHKTGWYSTPSERCKCATREECDA